MIITRAPFRISLFGGSTDYEDYYKENGSLLIGTTIDKHVYTSFRFRPNILKKQSIISYSKREEVESYRDIEHPLIKTLLRQFNIKKPLEMSVFADIPSRTGLGGSSAFCVSLLYILRQIRGLPITPKSLALDAINAERVRLKEAGGIQDQIWSSHGGLNSIKIDTNGNFAVRPLPVSREFSNLLNESMILVYTNEDKRTDKVAESHKNVNKDVLLDIAQQGYNAIVNEDITEIGNLLKQSWDEKRKISPLISSDKIDAMVNKMLGFGCFGVKLLGSGGSGFLLGIGDSYSMWACRDYFGDKVLDFKFEKEGVSCVFQTKDDIY